jgi:potassium voltage-gated channel Eag-related subfamily H protein 7
MMYLGYLLPVRLAFTMTASGPAEVMVDLIIDLSVWIDMFLQMRMCSYDAKTKVLIHDQKQIKKDYMRTWFLVDFFSVVPADQILLVVGTVMVEHDSLFELGSVLLDYSVSARLMRLLRLVRLLKINDLLNMDKVTHQLYEVMKTFGVTKLQIAFYFRVFFLVVLILASGHFLGCIWLMLGRHNVLKQTNPEGWCAAEFNL